MKLFVALLFAVGSLYAQDSFTYQLGFPTTGGSPALPKTCYQGASGTNALCIQPPSTIASNATLTLPQPTGSAGCVTDTTGGGVLAIASCIGSPPFTFSGSTGTPILTLTQTGAGGALYVNGTAAVNVNSSVTALNVIQAGSGYGLTVNGGFNAIAANSTSPALTMTQAGSGIALQLGGFSFLTANNNSNPTLTVTQFGIGGALSLYGPEGITINSSQAGLTVTQSGSGFALTASGISSIAANSNTNAALLLIQSGTADAFSVTGNEQISGTSTIQGTLNLGVGTQAASIQQGGGNWYITGIGVGYFKDVAARYVFTSLGDVPSTGTVNDASGTLTLTSGTAFDISMVGGTIWLCPSTCASNLTNGNGYRVTGFTDYQHITISPIGVNGGYSFYYAANSFQTSQGTMQISGDGYGAFQNVLVTNGFTSLGGATSSGNMSVAGDLVTITWTGGAVFNPSMVGGLITIGGYKYLVGTYTSPGIIKLSSSTSVSPAGVTVSAGAHAYTYVSTALQTSSGYNIDYLGNAVFKTGSFDNGFTVGAFGGAGLYGMTTTGGFTANGIIATGLTMGSYDFNNSGLIDVSAINFVTGTSGYNTWDVTTGIKATSFYTTDTLDPGYAIRAGTLNKWAWHASSSNYNLQLSRFDNSGTLVDTPITVSRSTGSTTFADALVFNGTISGTHGQSIGTGDSPTFNSITVSSCTGCGGGGGVTSLSAGSGISLSGSTGAVTVTNAGVRTLTGVTLGVSASTGAVTITGANAHTIGNGVGACVADGSDGRPTSCAGLDLPVAFGLGGASGSMPGTYSGLIYVYSSTGAYIGAIPVF